MTTNPRRMWKPSKKFAKFFIGILFFLTLGFAIASIVFEKAELLWPALLILILPIITLDTYISLAFPKGDQTAKDVVHIWAVNVLRFAEDLLEYSRKLLVDSLMQFITMIYVTSVMGLLTLRIFITPGGLPGIIAHYLLEYSRSTGQTDFTTVYAVFSAAIVMLILMIISMVIITYSAFQHEMPDDEAKPE